MIRGKRMFALLGLCAATAMVVMGQTFKTLYSFCKEVGCPDGEYPYAALVQGLNGSFYGTTNAGGTSFAGTIFKITPHGALTTLHTFTGPDGSGPEAGLILATNGHFYGTTSGGGTNAYGTVFKMTGAGALTTVHEFCVPGSCPDGDEPYAGLIQAHNGLFYGTTNNGGAGGYGTVYEMTGGGTMTTLDDLGSVNGYKAYAAPVQANDGDLYGTTYTFGAYGDGTLYKMTPSGTLKVLYNFCALSACSDGKNPWGGLIQGADGDLYGTTEWGGASESGTVFRITTGGALTTLYTFTGPDGARPYGSLVQGTDGNFYGTTYVGGAFGYGTIFQMTPGGVLTTLHSFGGSDGQYPMAGLVQGTNGIFYGTTEEGGAYSYGTVFSLSMGLEPFLETVPAAGKVGAAVMILGNNLASATSVTFNGTAAVYTATSTLITTTVPAGATTGTVEVVTPTGTLTSNTLFIVP